MDLSIADIMSTQIRKVDQADSVSHVREVFELNPVNALLVVDNSGAMVGIITSKDVVGSYLAGSTPVSQAMSEETITISPSDGPQAAAKKMLEEKCHHLIVVEGQNPVGILSTFDLLKVFTAA